MAASSGAVNSAGSAASGPASACDAGESTPASAEGAVSEASAALHAAIAVQLMTAHAATNVLMAGPSPTARATKSSAAGFQKTNQRGRNRHVRAPTIAPTPT